MDRFECLATKLHSLVIFRTLLQNNVLRLLLPLLSMAGKNTVEKVADYAEFASSLFMVSTNFTDYLWDCVSCDPNMYVRNCASGQPMGPVFEQCLQSELKALEEISQLSAREVKDAIGYDGYLPEWEVRPADFAREYMDRLARVPVLGYGMYSKYHVFSVAHHAISPEKFPDPVRLSDLKGYEWERKAVIGNTLALLSGKPAANVLLYGDAGTGKSSTVKAIANEYKDQGLRLVEIKKGQLMDIPSVMEALHQNPLKFILFIDDLSFSKGSGEIGALKAVLEGTVSAKASNAVIYATSNRRHLIQESFSDRGEDDIHRNETIQEQVSLSDRFGLGVRFIKPDKEKYLAIVRALARQYGIAETEALELSAERHALERGGRSPRVARQFVEKISSEKE